MLKPSPQGEGKRHEENKRKTANHAIDCFYGAGDEARTRYLHLGKVALYRMSYTRGNS